MHHRQCVYLYLVEVGEGLICDDHSVSPSSLGGCGGGAHLHHPQSVSLYLGGKWGQGSFASYNNVTLFVWRGKGLICIVHSVSSSTKIGELHSVSPSS